MEARDCLQMSLVNAVVTNPQATKYKRFCHRLCSRALNPSSRENSPGIKRSGDGSAGTTAEASTRSVTCFHATTRRPASARKHLNACGDATTRAAPAFLMSCQQLVSVRPAPYSCCKPSEHWQGGQQPPDASTRRCKQKEERSSWCAIAQRVGLLKRHQTSKSIYHNCLKPTRPV